MGLTSRVLLLAGLSQIVGCSSTNHPDSETNQLTNASFACVKYSDDSVAATKAEVPAGMIQGFQGERLNTMYNFVAGIPAPYRAYLENLYKKRIFQGIQAANTDDAVGITWSGYDPSVVQISSSFPGAIEFALQHELGHAVEAYISRSPKGQAANFYSGIQRAFATDGRNSRLRSYAQSSWKEYFAEVFNNFYCGEQSHNFIRDQLPTTYAFVNAVLEQPVWASAAASTYSKDIYIAIPDDPSGIALATDTQLNTVFVSATKAVQKAMVCVGAQNECLKLGKVTGDVVEMRKISGKNDGRSWFRPTCSIPLKNGALTLTFLGLNNKNVLTHSKTFNIQSKN